MNVQSFLGFILIIAGMAIGLILFILGMNASVYNPNLFRYGWMIAFAFAIVGVLVIVKYKS